MKWSGAWSEVLDTLCPMHLILDNAGTIRSVGPTLAKLRPEGWFVGRPFLDRFEMLRPRGVASMADLERIAGQKLHLRLAGAPQTGVKGVMVPAPAAGGAVVNLSFGISVMDAVQDYALTGADFAATDLAVEMLFLVEAKSAAMEASRMLNMRLQGAKIAAEEQAFTDTLTGLKNRRALDHVLSRLIEARAAFAVMHVDLDYFKDINDTMGHAAGDHVLQQVARIMVEETRDSDTVARVGGDEFVLVFRQPTDRRKLLGIANRLIDRLQQPIPYGGQTCRISCSIGTVLSSDYRTPTIPRLLDDADVALYASKHAGRGRHTYYNADLRANDLPMRQ